MCFFCNVCFAHGWHTHTPCLFLNCNQCWCCCKARDWSRGDLRLNMREICVRRTSDTSWLLLSGFNPPHEAVTVVHNEPQQFCRRHLVMWSCVRSAWSIFTHHTNQKNYRKTPNTYLCVWAYGTVKYRLVTVGPVGRFNLARYVQGLNFPLVKPKSKTVGVHVSAWQDHTDTQRSLTCLERNFLTVAPELSVHLKQPVWTNRSDHLERFAGKQTYQGSNSWMMLSKRMTAKSLELKPANHARNRMVKDSKDCHPAGWDRPPDRPPPPAPALLPLSDTAVLLRPFPE